MTLLETVMTGLQQWQWIGILLARLAAGLLFVNSGQGKLFVEEKRKTMQQTMRDAGVPMPELNAVVVSYVELICGLLLVVGLLTPLACIMLSGVMAVAILTVQVKSIQSASLWAWLGDFLYLPEVLTLVILIWLFFAGAGPLSLDRLLFSA